MVCERRYMGQAEGGMVDGVEGMGCRRVCLGSRGMVFNVIEIAEREEEGCEERGGKLGPGVWGGVP